MRSPPAPDPMISRFASSIEPFAPMTWLATLGHHSGDADGGEFLALPDDEKARYGAYMTDRLASYVDDAGMAVPQENHLLFAVR